MTTMEHEEKDARSQEESEIRLVFESWVKAIRAQDSKALVSSFASDVLMFDLINPLQYVGPDATRNRAEEWLSSFQGPINYENRDLRVTASQDVAFAHSLNRIDATTKDGRKIDMWWRATVCFCKRNGQWVVTHEHSSVPFDMHSGKASLGLKP
jgi:uncharacterized protein (TIGR02246 family)